VSVIRNLVVGVTQDSAEPGSLLVAALQNEVDAILTDSSIRGRREDKGVEALLQFVEQQLRLDKF